MNQQASLAEQIRTNNTTEQQLSEALDVKVPTLRNWRSQGKGPEWLKIGREVLYPNDAIFAWLNQQRSKAS